MNTMIRYPVGQRLPQEWQAGWNLAATIPLASLPQGRVARAAAGTPIPTGCEEYTTPCPSEADRRLARRDIAVLLKCAQKTQSGDREWRIATYQRAMADDETVDRHIASYIGTAHPFAACAPLHVTALQQAISAHVDAEGLWSSPTSCAVIRTAPSGYAVWIGVGGMMIPAGIAETYTEAEARALSGVRAHRAKVMASVAEILAGWADDTPYYSATLATAEAMLPIAIRRGPMTAAELLGDATSWSIPIVAVVEGDSITRHAERVTWDDEESRERQRQRQRAGKSRRDGEIARALELLRQYPAVAPYVREHDLAPATIAVPHGTVQLVGPVCMRDDGACPLALVREARPGGRERRYWMAIGTFSRLAGGQ